jgi:hypothetical protein
MHYKGEDETYFHLDFAFFPLFLEFCPARYCWNESASSAKRFSNL